MELREFIRETLTEILGGIQEAQAAINTLSGKGGIINPVWNDTSDLSGHVQPVQFDVAVTASDQAAKGGKGGIKVWAAQVGGELSTKSENSIVTRISFSVPILPPATVVQDVNKPTTVSSAANLA